VRLVTASLACVENSNELFVRMTITFPDDDGALLKFTADDLRLELACALYARRRITLSQGARLAGIERMAFQESLCDRDIDMHYSSDDLQTDLASLEAVLGA
jgi:predicted HTH domain antitoxin